MKIIKVKELQEKIKTQTRVRLSHYLRIGCIYIDYSLLYLVIIKQAKQMWLLQKTKSKNRITERKCGSNFIELKATI